MIGATQWFCENEDCDVIAWNPTRDAAQQLASPHVVTPTWPMP
jgi:hypothetical protein